MEVQRSPKFPLGIKVESMAEVAFECGLEGWTGFGNEKAEKRELFQTEGTLEQGRQLERGH